jgi:hypothetical protein
MSTGFKYSFLETGYFSKRWFGRIGRFSNPPPQLGQILNKISYTQSLQNVHSKVQIMASLLSFGSGFPQF